MKLLNINWNQKERTRLFTQKNITSRIQTAILLNE